MAFRKCNLECADTSMRNETPARGRSASKPRGRSSCRSASSRWRFAKRYLNKDSTYRYYSTVRNNNLNRRLGQRMLLLWNFRSTHTKSAPFRRDLRKHRGSSRRDPGAGGTAALHGLHDERRVVPHVRAHLVAAELRAICGPGRIASLPNDRRRRKKL